MRNRILLAFLLVLSVATRGFAGNIRTEIDGKLIALNGDKTEPYKGSEYSKAKYVALYFSAGWCGPCHLFTPQLSDFYKALKAIYPEFEIVFVSRDFTEEAMHKYMAETAMPWPAVRFEVAKGNEALNKLCGPAIPDLVLLNEKGDVISDTFVDGAYVGPGKVMKDLVMLVDPTGSLIEEETPAPVPPMAPPENAEKPKTQ